MDGHRCQKHFQCQFIELSIKHKNTNGKIPSHHIHRATLPSEKKALGFVTLSLKPGTTLNNAGKVLKKMNLIAF